MPRSLRFVVTASLALATAVAPAAAQKTLPHTANASSVRRPITIRWLGHATFVVTSPGGTRLMLDPFITGNPSTPDSLKRLSRWEGVNRPAAILVTHSHEDHALDAKALAQATGAPVIGAYDWINTLGLPAAQAMGGNVGGTFRIGDVVIHLVPAMHGSVPGGRPLGFVLQFADGRTLYDTGDTWIFGDMSFIQQLYHPSILLLNVGGGPFTEDPPTAALAVKTFFHPTTIIPMHYATFPGLATESDVRRAFAGDARLAVMHPGETRQF